MSELPNSWTETTIREVFSRLQYGLTAKADFEHDGIRFLRITDIRDGKIDWEKVPSCLLDAVSTDKYRLFDGDFVFARSGSIEKAARISGAPEAVFASYLIRARPIDESTGDWLEWFVQTPIYLDQVLRAATGVGMSNVNAQKLGAIKLPLAPSAEQHRISAKLNRLVARTRCARDELDRIPMLIEHYKRAVLNAAFRRNSGQDHALKEVADPDAPIRYGIVQPGSIKDKGILLIRVCDLVDNRIAWDELRRVTPEIDAKYSRARVQNGDVLVSIVGTIGRVALVQNMSEPTNIARAIARIRPDQNKILPEWLCYRLQAGDCQARFLGDVREVARKTLNFGLIKEASFIVPSLEDQKFTVQSIKSVLTRMRSALHETAKASKGLERLETAALDKAFRGELVPQDPNDEPASVLLERIRAEHEQQFQARSAPHRGRQAKQEKKTVRRRRQIMGKKRAEVERDHLGKTLKGLGGRAGARELWQRSEMDIDEFYKQLRVEVKAGHIREGASKDELVLADAA